MRQTFKRQMLRDVYLEPDGRPRWNNLFTKEHVLTATGHECPENELARWLCLRDLGRAISRYKKADTYVLRLNTPPEVIRLNAFVIVYLNGTWLSGYTSSPVVAFKDLDRRFRRIKGRMETELEWLADVQDFDLDYSTRKDLERLQDAATEFYLESLGIYARIRKHIEMLLDA